MHATQSQSAPVRCNTYTDTSFEPNLRGSKQDGEESVRMDGATAPTTRRERTRRPDAVPLHDSGGRVTKRSITYTTKHIIEATETKPTLSSDGHVRLCGQTNETHHSSEATLLLQVATLGADNGVV